MKTENQNGRREKHLEHTIHGSVPKDEWEKFLKTHFKPGNKQQSLCSPVGPDPAAPNPALHWAVHPLTPSVAQRSQAVSQSLNAMDRPPSTVITSRSPGCRPLHRGEKKGTEKTFLLAPSRHPVTLDKMIPKKTEMPACPGYKTSRRRSRVQTLVQLWSRLKYLFSLWQFSRGGGGPRPRPSKPQLLDLIVVILA